MMLLSYRIPQLGIFCECASLREALGQALRNEEWIERVVELEADRGVGVMSSARGIEILLFVLSVAHRSSEDVLKRLQTLTPRPKFLLLSLDDDNRVALDALQAGALGVLSKGAQLDELLRAIRLVHSGQRYLSGPIQRVFADRYMSSRLLAAREEHLTKRETEILRLLALGSNHHEISRQLFVSVKTVDTHRSNILRKLQLRNNADIARYAIRNGLIDANTES
jgi:DNA-binding NarL/FixJ family response regulator